MARFSALVALLAAPGAAAVQESMLDPSTEQKMAAAGPQFASSLPPQAPTESWNEAPADLSDEEQELAAALGVGRRLDWWKSSYSFDYYEEYSYATYSFSYEDIALVGGTIKVILKDLPMSATEVFEANILEYPNYDNYGGANGGTRCSPDQYDINIDKYYNSWIPGQPGTPDSRLDMTAAERAVEWYSQPFTFWNEHFMKPHEDFLRFSLVDVQYSSCFDKAAHGGIAPDQWTAVVFSFRMEVAYTLDDVAPFAADDDPVLMYAVEQYTKTVYTDIIPYLRGEGSGPDADDDWLASLCGSTTVNGDDTKCDGSQSFTRDGPGLQLSQSGFTDSEIKDQLQVEPSVLAAIDSINSLLPDPDINIRPTGQPTQGPTEHWEIGSGAEFAEAYFDSSGEIGMACSPQLATFGHHFQSAFCPMLQQSFTDDIWVDRAETYIEDAKARGDS